MTGESGRPVDAHRAFDELAVGWALHALEPEDEAVFAVHLRGCACCAETVAQTTEVMAAMATDLPPAAPSEDLRSRLRAAVQDTEQVRVPEARPAPVAVSEEPGPVSHRLWPRRRRVLSVALAAVAVAAVAGLGLWNVVLHSDRQELQATVAAQREAVERVLTPGRATIAPLTSDGRPVATVVARSGEVQVLTYGLSVNDAAATSYVVWGLGDEEAVALGTFDVEQPQMEVRTVGSGRTGLDGYARYGISIEPGQEAPSAPTEVVATGQVTS
jgi:hypothetical protein